MCSTKAASKAVTLEGSSLSLFTLCCRTEVIRTGILLLPDKSFRQLRIVRVAHTVSRICVSGCLSSFCFFALFLQQPSLCFLFFCLVCFHVLFPLMMFLLKLLKFSFVVQCCTLPIGVRVRGRRLVS